MKTFALAMVMAVLASSAALAKTGGEEIPQGHRASQSSGAQQGANRDGGLSGDF